MNPVSVAAADAIVSAINAATWALAVQAARAYTPGVPAGTPSDDILAAVLPFADERELDTRETSAADATIAIGLSRAVANPDDVAAVDAISGVFEDIRRSLEGEQFGILYVVETSRNPLIDFELLRTSSHVYATLNLSLVAEGAA